MKRKAIALGIGLLILLFAFTGFSMASGDNNQHTNGEDGNYEENNNNPHDLDSDFPGENNQTRNGVVW